MPPTLGAHVFQSPLARPVVRHAPNPPSPWPGCVIQVGPRWMWLVARSGSSEKRVIVSGGATGAGAVWTIRHNCLEAVGGRWTAEGPHGRAAGRS